VITHGRIPTNDLVRVSSDEIERLQKRVGELEVENARERARNESLILGTTAHAERHEILFTALQDLLAFHDKGSSEWTSADVHRLEEIRKLVMP
jgi:hypothetical protein